MSNTERTNERFDLGEGIARQELNVIFVIDNSGSMAGEKIGAVNNAIRDIMSIMPDIQDDTGDATIKISALTFSDDAKWIYSEPKTIEEFKWRDIGTEGATNLLHHWDVAEAEDRAYRFASAPHRAIRLAVPFASIGHRDHPI